MNKLGLAAIVFSVAACDRGMDLDVQFDFGPGPGARHVLAADWTEKWSWGGSADTLLYHPYWIRADARRLVVYDGPTRTIIVFSRDGDVLWTWSRPEGQGPRDLLTVRDVRLTSAGGVTLLDSGNGRYWEISPAGETLRVISHEELQRAEQMLALSENKFILAGLSGHWHLAQLDLATGALDSVRNPWPEFIRLHPIHRQGILQGGSHAWVFASSVGAGLALFQDSEPQWARSAVEASPLPTVAIRRRGRHRWSAQLTGAVATAKGLGRFGDTVAVHYGGRSSKAGQWLDLYEAQAGLYLGSFELPRLVRRVALSGSNRVYVLVNDPFPRIIALDLVRRG